MFQTIATIPKSVTGKEELVVLSRKEYEELQSRAFPVITLQKKAAQRLDKRVREALREHSRGTSVGFDEFLQKRHTRH